MGRYVTFSTYGNFRKTFKFLQAIREKRIYSILDFYGQKGVSLLSKETPKRTGLTAGSWSYVKKVSEESISLEWHNSSMGSDGKTPIVVLIMNGHGTSTGGYVPPNDFVTPVMEDLFKETSEAVWKAVTSL